MLEFDDLFLLGVRQTRCIAIAESCHTILKVFVTICCLGESATKEYQR